MNHPSIPPSEEDARDIKVKRLADFEEDITKHIQLIPTLPADADEHDAVVEAGKWNGIWIRVRSALDEAQLGVIIDEEVAKHSGAVYVCLPQALCASAGHLLGMVLKRGFTFYTFHRETGELCYYLWTRQDLRDMVPSYATSIEGGGVLVLSPDESEVLLVFEYGRWGRCGGAVDAGETCLQCALREVVEETQVVLDSDVAPRLGLVYDQPRSRDGLVNDHFMLFVARAASKELTLVGVE